MQRLGRRTVLPSSSTFSSAKRSWGVAQGSLLLSREFNGLPEGIRQPPQWKSKFNRVSRDWRDLSIPITHDNPHSQGYKEARPQPLFGCRDAYYGGSVDPPYYTLFQPENQPTMFQPELTMYKENYVKFVMLNRPKALHSLNLPTVRALGPLLKKWDRQQQTTIAIFLASASGEHFCAGTDFIDIYNAVQSGDKQYARTYFRELYTMLQTINGLEKPFFPIMHGYTMGSGAALAFHSDSFKVATEEAIFAMPEVGMGFVPDCGSTHILAQLPDEIGTFLLLTGKRMRGWDLLHSGIATHIIPNDRLNVLVQSLGAITQLEHSSAIVVDKFYDLACQRGEHPFLFKKKGYLDIVKRCFNKDTVPEIMAALENEFDPWAHEVLKTMQENCPLSMAVTLKLVRQGRTGTLADSMDAEYRAAVRLVEMPDFAEGVRARIIEKRKPLWSHASVKLVTEAEVNRILAPLPPEEELDSITFCTPYVRRMAEVDNFINNSYSDLCYSILKNKLMGLTTLKKERMSLQTTIATEMRPEVRMTLEEDLKKLDAEIAATEALDPENPSEDMKQLLKDGRTHLEKLARGKENIEEWKTKAQEFYKLWVAGTKAKMRVKEAKPEVDKDIYGWTKFFRKEPDTTTTATATTATTPAGSTPAKPAGTSGSLSLGDRLGDRLAEKLRAARESKLQMGAASKPVTEKGSSLAEKLFGAPKPATSAAGAEGAAPTPKQSLTESLLAAVSKQAGPAPTPAIEEDASSLLPSDTIDEATWKNLAEQWERWTQPLFPSYGNQRITIDSFEIGKEKFEEWVNERMESPREIREKYLNAEKWHIDMEGVDKDMVTGASADREMAYLYTYFKSGLKLPEGNPDRYFADQVPFYFRDRLQTPLYRLGRDMAYHDYGTGGEMATWKERIKVRDSMDRKRGEEWEHTGYTSQDLEDYVVECREESMAIPEKYRYVSDVDLVVARSLMGWQIRPKMPVPRLALYDDLPLELTREQLEQETLELDDIDEVGDDDYDEDDDLGLEDEEEQEEDEGLGEEGGQASGNVTFW